MATDLSFVQYIAEQTESAGKMTFKKMFGEYALYCNGKVVGLVCDNQLFIKPTQGGKAFIGEVVESPAYPGAKNSFLIEDQLDDKDWMAQLIQITYLELPEPKPKKKKKREE